MQSTRSLEGMTLEQLLDEGLHCYHDRQLEQALIYFEALLEMASSNTELLHSIIKLLQEMGDFSKAAIYGEKLLELSPEDDDFLLTQAENYFLLKDHPRALDIYLKINNKHPTSLHLLNRFIIIYNDEIECLVTEKKKLVTKDVFDQSVLVNTALALSENLLDENKLDASKVILESLLLIENENLDALGLYGLYLEKVNDYDEAIFCLDKAVNGAYFKYLTALTKCIEQRFSISAVVHYLEKLVQKFPNDELNKKLLGFYYYRNADYVNANRVLSTFTTLHEDDIYTFKYRALSRFKMIDERSGSLDKNELVSLMNDFVYLWKKLPRDGETLSHFVMFYLNLGEIEKAFDICTKLDLILPGDLTNQWNKHIYFRAKGDKNEFFNSYLAGRHVRYRGSWGLVKDKVWNGEDIKDKRVIVFREQGIGDELLFASNYSWLVDKAAHIDIFCASRLKEIFSEAFPSIKFHPVLESTFNCSDKDTYQLISKADKVILSGDLLEYVYRKTGACLFDEKYLNIKNNKKKFWSEKVNNLIGKSKPKVGLIWRSGFVNGSRSRYYLSEHEVAFVISSLPEVEFVNCMYVECEDELSEIEKLANKKIHRLNKLDQKNDFENTAAMLSNLDLLFGAYTATLSLAVAVGTPAVAYSADYLKEDKKLKKEAFYYSNVSHISLPLNDSVKRKKAINLIIDEIRDKLNF